MKLAYIILAHKQPEQLIRLVRRLSADNTVFFIHIDKKTPEATHARITEGLRASSNVRFLQRCRCYWGGFGHLKATITGLHAIANEGTTADYVMLLTGQDYPIKSNERIDELLRRHDGSIFMECFSLPALKWEHGGMNRIEDWHYRPLGQHLAFPPRSIFRNRTWLKRKLPDGMKPFGGSSYWCLPRDCIEYICGRIDKDVALVDFFKYVSIPDEIFFQTLIMNSPLEHRVVNDNLRHIIWRDSPHPEVLVERDFVDMATSPALFARKFDTSADSKILDMIDRELLR